MKIIYWIKSFFLKFPKKCKAELKESALLLYRKYGFDIKFNSKSSFSLLVNKDVSRKGLMKEITSLPGFSYEGKGSSIGRIKYKEIIIYIKPKDKQGDLAPGKANENIFEKNILKYLENGHLNINFQYKSGETTEHYWVDDVTGIVNMSNTGSLQYNKSDFCLITKKKFNISLKQGGDFIWESSVTRYKYIYDKFVFHFKNNFIEYLEPVENTELPGKYFMMNPRNNKPYSKVLIKGFPEYNDENIIFGNEIPKPIIIERTFSDSDFSYDGNLTVTVDRIYKNVEDIELQGKLPVLAFSRNMSKPYGIDFKCIPEDKTKYTYKANVLEIPYEVLMKS